MSIENLQNLDLTPQEIEELNQPFTAKLAFEAVRLGMAQAISDAGLTPEEFEFLFRKFADGGGTFGGEIMSGLMKYPELMIGGGALLGAGAGVLHHKIDQTLAGNEDPEVVALKKKIKAYKTMSGDLQVGMQAAA